MASPLLRRGAKSRANLKRGGRDGKVSNKPTEQDREIRKLSKKLLTNPTYLANLKERLETGRIQPGVEAMLYYYAFGKPPETVETKQVVPVRIVHEYAEEK